MGLVRLRPAACAPAWRSGASATHPRLGTPMQPGDADSRRGIQVPRKKGAGMLKARKPLQKKPAGKAPYTPAHQQVHTKTKTRASLSEPMLPRSKRF